MKLSDQEYFIYDFGFRRKKHLTWVLTYALPCYANKANRMWKKKIILRWNEAWGNHHEGIEPGFKKDYGIELKARDDYRDKKMKILEITFDTIEDEAIFLMKVSDL